MEIITIVIFAVIVILVFEFIKHKFIKGSGKLVLTVVVIGVIALFAFYYLNIDSVKDLDFDGAKATGAAVFENLKGDLDNMNLAIPLSPLQARKVYKLPTVK